MNNLMKSQFFKIKRNRCLYIMLGVVLFMAFVGVTMASNMKAEGNVVTGVDVVFNSYGGDVCAMIVGILATFILCMDFTSGSIKQIIGKGVNRVKYTMASIFSVSITATIMLALLGLISFGFGIVIFGHTGSIEISSLGYLILGLIVIALNYTSYIAMITMAFRKISISLIFAILSPSLLDIFVRLISPVTDASVLSLNENVEKMISVETAFGERMASFGVMGILTVIMAVVALSIFKKKDIQ